jgi:hypothetical protein
VVCPCLECTFEQLFNFLKARVGPTPLEAGLGNSSQQQDPLEAISDKIAALKKQSRPLPEICHKIRR